MAQPQEEQRSQVQSLFYKRKVSSILLELSKIKDSYTASVLRDMTEEEIIVHLEVLGDLKLDFESNQARLEEEDFEELENDNRGKFRNLLVPIKTLLTRELNSRHVRSPAHSSTVRLPNAEDHQPTIVVAAPTKNRLPVLQIPCFSGSYTDWPNFMSMFETVIHNDQDLTSIEKLQHLRASLKGSALDAIKALEITDQNYDEALRILRSRFDNKRFTLQAHIKELSSIPVIGTSSVQKLRALSDKLNSHIRALSSLATKEQIADCIIIHLMTSKLDPKSQTKWEEQMAADTIPSLSSFLTFLDKRCQTLESVENAMVNTPRNQVSKNMYRNENSTKKVLVTSSSSNCSFCDFKGHSIYRCQRFSNLSPSLRLKEAKKLKLCINCLRSDHFLKDCKSSGCRHCSSMHHTLLHLSTDSGHPGGDIERQQTDEKPGGSSTLVSSSPQQKGIQNLRPENIDKNIVLLATAVILIRDRAGSFIPCRAVLDSASQLHFITSRVASLLNLKKHKSSILVSGIGSTDLTANHTVNVSIKSQTGDFSTSFTAVVTPSITENQPSSSINNIQWNIPKNIKLADPTFDKSQRVDLLIGASLFFDLLCVGQIKLGPSLPLLQKTKLGWVVSGGFQQTFKKSSCLAAYKMDQDYDDNLDKAVRAFWEIESIEITQSKVSKEEIDCEHHFLETYSRLETGEYSVRLPIKDDLSKLGNSYNSALSRFKNLEKKFQNNPDLKSQYEAFITEYKELNHMSLVTEIPSKTPVCYLPHHCVFKEDSTSTKIRVVFDGSAKGSFGVSLNDILMNGPTIQPKLFDTLIRFRSHTIALTGDICKMYRCVRITPPDNYLQCILWRNTPEEPIQTFKLETVTYGTKSAAFLAIRAMQQLALDEQKNYPIGAQTVVEDFYVDDLISGGNSIDDVLEIKRQTSELLSCGNFKIRKWCSNAERVVNAIPEAEREKMLKFHDGTDITKTLGLYWDPKTDDFLFSFIPQEFPVKITKRTILSLIARFYDPLGLIGPVISKAKIFLQLLWKEKLNWDESLPQSLQKSWIEFCKELNLVGRYSFPRCVVQNKARVTIHGFCDASMSAYGACIYSHIEVNGTSQINLLCSKSRVAPLKMISVPKLELSAAALLAELISHISSLKVFESDFYCWSDSTIVLHWLKGIPSNFNVFVGNRISKIQQLTIGMTWRYVPSESNPADILSRGATPRELMQSALWKSGPEFLHQSSQHWPDCPALNQRLPELRKTALLITSTITDLSLTCKFVNSFDKLQRVFAYIYKFRLSNSGQRGDGYHLNPTHIKFGTYMLLRMIQQSIFAPEIKDLTSKSHLTKSSSLVNLNPFICGFGLLRVGGRLNNSELNFDARHPIILPRKHPVTDSIILHFHKRLLHAGPQALLASIRQQYWPIGGRQTVTRVINKCIICFRVKPRIAEQLMGSLPPDRVHERRAFATTGIDFFGPFFYKAEVRNRPPVKCYISLFICFSTKAVHMEIVKDLSTASFLAALRRFISLRGKPQTIWSDNATNFVGAKNELAELRQLFLSNSHMDAVYQQCLSDGINWKFIPPRSPHFGGLWEAAVKLAKFHFYRIAGLSILGFDELRTLVCEISAIINSRPLCLISENPDDLDVLTPAHFLIGTTFTSIVEPDVTHINFNRLDKWQMVSQLKQQFWKKWCSEYLSNLQERTKWRHATSNLSIGSMVLIKDEGLPPLRWPLARITDLVKGKDGIARVAILRTSGGILRRAIAKLCPLPTNDEHLESQDLSTGGECLETS